MKGDVSLKVSKINLQGMTCVGCERRIETRLSKISSIKSVKANYDMGTVLIEYEEAFISEAEILKILEKMGYSSSEIRSYSKVKDLVVILLVLFLIYQILKITGLIYTFNEFPLAKAGMGYVTIFLIGVLTSVHCIAMCGGINISQCALGESSYIPSLKYNFGRVVSYTIIGAVVGAIGSVFSLSGTSKALLMSFAGIFMIIMGLNMMDIFPFLRKFNLRVPKFISDKVHEKKKNATPFYVGILNGLMPCGPLQAMQLYALSTGSAFQGALSMFLFSVGTFPLMFGLGVMSSMLNKKFKKNMILVSSVLVVILGVLMFQNSTSFYNAKQVVDNTDSSKISSTLMEDGKQIIETDVWPSSYESIVVQKDIPVKWIMNVEEENLNGCNNEIIIPEYDIDIKLKAGENIVEFTPTETGTFKYSCWMGMIRSTITVVDDIKSSGTIADTQNDAVVQTGSGGACCAIENK